MIRFFGFYICFAPVAKKRTEAAALGVPQWPVVGPLTRSHPLRADGTVL